MRRRASRLPSHRDPDYGSEYTSEDFDMEIVSEIGARGVEPLADEFAFIGRHTTTLDLLHRADRVAVSDAPVLITGESGTGKELVARRVHANSRRANGAFVSVNCAALVESLELSELFGHTAGAFTGANGRKKGRFESAAGGTIFLDEIAETKPAFQAKLLRVLQSGEYSPVGASESMRCDVRVIAATNRDLSVAMRNGEFREDLFYRLNVVRLPVPPLRERRSDIVVLCDHFLERYATRYAVEPPRLADSGREAIAAHAFRGNVRELENLAHRLVVLFPGEEVGACELGLESDGEVAEVESWHGDVSVPFHEAKRRVVEQFELGYLRAVIEQCDGVVRHAAERAGLSERGLHMKLRSHGLTARRLRRVD